MCNTPSFLGKFNFPQVCFTTRIVPESSVYDKIQGYIEGDDLAKLDVIEAKKIRLQAQKFIVREGVLFKLTRHNDMPAQPYSVTT
jgi:hypothetical protein